MEILVISTEVKFIEISKKKIRKNYKSILNLRKKSILIKFIYIFIS